MPERLRDLPPGWLLEDVKAAARRYRPRPRLPADEAEAQRLADRAGIPVDFARQWLRDRAAAGRGR